MQLIIFDLEWNMGYKPYLFDYHGAEQTLRGELIQIGAVKVDEAGRMLDSLQLNLRPRLFRKLHHHIAKVTGMTQSQLDAGVPIKEGLRRFMDWCGPDAAFGEWGMDDVPVLKQNLFLNGLDESWPHRWYDLQQVFLAQRGRAEGEGMTLESVVDRLGIEKDEPFHDALSDAKYTARVCQQLDLAAGLAAYPSEEDSLRATLCGGEGEFADFVYSPGHIQREDFREQETLKNAACPVCGAAMKPDPHDVWLRRGNTGYYSLYECAAHGGFMVRFKLARRDGLHWSVARVTENPTEAQLAQWKAQKAKALARLRRAAQERVAQAGR